MKRFIAPLAVIVLAGIAPLAQATIQISYQIGSAASPTYCVPPGANDADCGVFTSGGLSISGLTAHANLTGSSSLAITTGSETHLENPTAAPIRIRINVLASGFILPLTPPGPALEFNSGVSSGSPLPRSGDSTMSFRSCVDQSGVAASCTDAVIGGAVAPYVSAWLSPNVATKPTDNKDAPTLVIPLLTTGYALDEEFDITVGALATVTFSSGSTLTPVPEPMSIALLGGVVLLTSRLIRRKRSLVS